MLRRWSLLGWEHVGAEVRDYNDGDEVYARPCDLRIGAFEEYVAIDQADIALKPRSLTMEQAAAAGALRPMLDRTFPFDETLDAMAYVEHGYARGKIVVVLPPPST